MEKAYKGMIGDYTVIKDGDDKHEATHIVLTVKEFSKIENKIEKLQAGLDNAQKQRHQAEDNIERIKREAVNVIEKERKNMAEKIQQVEADKVYAENERVQLLEIMKNRANAKRGIKPKKQHDGYVVLRSEQYEFGYPISRSERQTHTLWRTTIETPIDIGIHAPEAQKLINEAFLHKFGGRLGFSKVAITGGGLADSIKSVNKDDWIKSLYLLDIKYRQNTKSGLWEVTYIHNLAIFIPEDMYAS